MTNLKAYLWFARLYFVLAAGAVVVGAWYGQWFYAVAGGFTILLAIALGNLIVAVEEQEIRIRMLSANLEKCWEKTYYDKIRGLSDTDKSG